MDIPIIVVCYNNYKYVRNFLSQIFKINKDYYNNIQILNNKSTCPDTIKFLETIDVKVINNTHNNGPWIKTYCNADIYHSLPNKFILSDPDLKFHENIPSNFIEILSLLADKYETGKIGAALDISDSEKFYKTDNYANGQSIYDWEKQFWDNKVYDDTYELYNAPIDTTFCLINKKYASDDCYQIRVAGSFVMKHLPWYTENELFSDYENYINNIKSTNISTTSKTIINYIESKYLRVDKNEQIFLIRKDEKDQNFSFWRDHYNHWENETFQVFDRFLSKDKVFIDIGGWIGTTAMYGSRKSKHVYSVDADNDSVRDMENNFKINCEDNYTLINKAIFNVDDIDIKFGKNLNLENSKMNDSTSQIYTDNLESNQYYIVKTTTINSILREYKINVDEVSLIKVDIEGGEEYILDDLYNIYEKYKIPLYVSFHYSWWNNKDLDRFTFLSVDKKNQIISYPFTSILFN